MPTYVFTGYSPDALVYDSGSNSWSLRPDYDPAVHRVTFEITDDDAYLGGDNFNDEVGNDYNQTATVTDMGGTPIASGQVYDEEFYVLNDPSTGSIWVERIEIGGQHVGYLVSAPLDPALTYNQTTAMDAQDEAIDSDTPHGNTALYSSFAQVPCFAHGTMIATPEGDRPVETLQVGDLVTTHASGAQPIRWTASRIVGRQQLMARPDLRPIALEPQWTGCDERLLLSPQHGVLVTSPEFPHGRLVRAIQLARLAGGGVRIAQGAQTVHYVHLMLPRHGVIYANNVATESFYPGRRAIRNLSSAARLSLCAAFPADIWGDPANWYGDPIVPYARLSDLPGHLGALVPMHLDLSSRAHDRVA